jgi:hypothetical protein
MLILNKYIDMFNINFDALKFFIKNPIYYQNVLKIND